MSELVDVFLSKAAYWRERGNASMETAYLAAAADLMCSDEEAASSEEQPA